MDSTKRLLVSFLVIASVLAMTSFAAAASGDAVNYTSVKVNGLEAYAGTPYNVAVLAGQSIPVTVTFTANAANGNQSNVRLSADLQGYTNDVSNEILVGDIEAGKTYIRSLVLKVPSSMADVQSDNLNLVLNMWNGDFSQQQEVIPLRQQRQTYDVNVMSLSTPNSVKAGSSLPVNVVLKNTGYNNLDDLYVTVSVPGLNVQKTAYFGDLANAVDNNDTISGTVYVQLPYNATPGTYTVRADVKYAGSFEKTAVTTVNLENQFESNVVAGTSQVSANVGAQASYDLTIVNPTDSIAMYNIVPETNSDVSVSADSVVVVPAGSSKTVTVTAKANSAGTHKFSVDVLSGSKLTGQVALSLDANSGISNPVAILTVVLAVIFVVLLVVLIVLVTKKPAKKQEEFGESYY